MSFLFTVAATAATVFIHFGLNEFASTQFACFLLLLLAAIPRLLSVFRRLIAPASIFLGAVLLSFFAADQDIRTLAKGVRTLLVMLILVAFACVPLKDRWRHVFLRSLTGTVFLSGVLAALQLLDSLSGSRGLFDIPPSWFALDYGTLFTERRDALAASGYLIRPSATFSEPSALAALGLAGVFVGLNLRAWKLVSISLATTTLSMSLAGLFFGFLLIATAIVRSAQKKLGASFVLAVAAAGLITIIFMIDPLYGRIQALLLGADPSTQARVILPMKMLSSIVESQLYFGINQETAAGFAEGVSVFDNWLLNQFIFYGVGGVAVLLALCLLFPVWLLPLLAAYAVMNGDAFYYDRMWLLFLVIAICSVRHRRNSSQ